MTPSWHIAADERGVTALRLRKASSRNVTKLGGDVRSARWRAIHCRSLFLVIAWCGDGTFDAFVLGPGWKKRLLRLEKSFAKTEALEEVDAVRFGPFRAKF